jgi:RecJ-like exonuclease
MGTAMFKPACFQEWRDRLDAQRAAELRAAAAAGEEVECPSCDGEGEVECGECGGSKACTRCDGDGVLPARQVTWTPASAASACAVAEYRKAVEEDARAWAAWLGCDVTEDLARAGFVVASDTATRSLRVVGGGL